MEKAEDVVVQLWEMKLKETEKEPYKSHRSEFTGAMVEIKHENPSEEEQVFSKAF